MASYGSPEYIKDEVVTKVNDLFNKLTAENKLLQQKLNGGKVMKLHPIDAMKWPPREYRTYHGYIEVDDTVEKCNLLLNQLDQHNVTIQNLIKENDIAINNNKIILENAITFMTQLGASQQIYQSQSIGRRKKDVLVSCGWVTELHKLIPISDARYSYQSNYTDRVRSLNEKIISIKKKIADEKLVQETEEKKLIDAKELAQYQVKYDLSATADWDDVLERILSKNKYLYLSHYLAANRSNWSDGYDLATIGLDGFKEETALDNKIASCIQNCIDNWDGDGRCFRDCEYNYYVIMDEVKNDILIKDYNFVSNKIPN